MITNIRSKRARLQHLQLALKRLRARLCLLKFKLLRAALGLKIGALTLYSLVFRLEQNKMLAQDRRRAVLVDQFFQQLKHRTDPRNQTP